MEEGKSAAPWSPSQALMACGFQLQARTLSILASAEALDAALFAIKKRVSPHSLYPAQARLPSHMPVSLLIAGAGSAC